MELSLIIPAHNEERRLPTTLLTYADAMQHRFGDDFEILVVANGCTDDTVRVAEELAGSYPQLRVIDIKEAVGKGGAVLEGFGEARGDRVIFADADGATTADSLLELFEELDEHDVVIGSRRLEGSRILRPQSLRRRGFGLTFALATRLLFRMPFKDTQCGAKAFRNSAVRPLGQIVRETRWTFDLDLLLSARRLGFDVYEYPVVWADQDGSQLRFASTAYEVLRTLLQMKLRQHQPLPITPEQVLLEMAYEPESGRAA